MKAKRIILPDGSIKIEVVKDSLEVIEERERVRLENSKKFHEKTAKNQGFKNRSDYEDDLAIRNGFKNKLEYNDNWAIKNGYENYSKYQNERRYIRGDNLPMSINKECSSYLGVHITEINIVSKLFPDAIKMPYGNPGFDYLDPVYGKLEVKSSYLDKNGSFYFKIKNNRIPDNFIFFGYDRKLNINILHIWLIKGDEIIIKSGEIGRKLNDRNTLSITKRRLNYYKKYENFDLLNKVKEIIQNLKA